jgi:phosphopantetheinyl transferase
MDILAICRLVEPPAQVATIPLSHHEREFLSRARTLKRRREIEVSRRLMRHGLRHGLKLPDEYLAWSDKGPAYHGNPGSVGLSLAHSPGYAAVGLSNAGVIGVDIECAERKRPWRPMMESMFCADDQRWIANDTDTPGSRSTLERFLAVWTAREAYAKFRRESVLSRLSQPLLKECEPENYVNEQLCRVCVAVFCAPDWTAAVCRHWRNGSRPDEIAELAANGVVAPLRARYLFCVVDQS